MQNSNVCQLMFKPFPELSICSHSYVDTVSAKTYEYHYFPSLGKLLRVIFSEYRESEDTHEKSIFLLFHQNIPLDELIQGKIV